MKMKYILSLAAILFTLTVSAQKSKVQTAYLEFQDGSYSKAKTAIDLAVAHPKTSTSAKAWYYKGLIYLNLFGHKEFGELCDNCLTEAHDAFKKTEEYDSKNYYASDIKSKRRDLAAQFEESGRRSFISKDFDKALETFEFLVKAPEFKLAEDTNVIRNVFIAAKKASNSDKLMEYGDKLFEKGFQKPWMFADMASAMNAKKTPEDTTKAMEILSKGLKAFPSDISLIIEELNYYLSRGKYTEAIAKLEKAERLESENASIINALGLAYEKSGNTDKALEKYNRALEINPEMFNASYGAGAVYFNLAAEKYNDAQKIPYSQTKKYDAAKKEYIDLFNKAMPYLEKAREINPKDLDTLYSLQQLYLKIDDMKKSIEIKAIKDKLMSEQG